MAEHVEQVSIAQAGGYDGVTIGTHLSYGSAAWLPPFPTLARLAPAAAGMSLSTCMLVLPYHHPLQVAIDGAFLDVLCGGAFTLGVSAGWARDEFAQLGIDRRERVCRFTESLDLIDRLWSQDRVSFEGKYYRVDDVSLALRPVRSPRPPVWLGGSVTRSVQRAAELADTAIGDTWVASSHLTEAVIVEQAETFGARLAELGKPRPADFPLLRNIVVAEDRSTALREAVPYLQASYQVFDRWGLFSEVVGDPGAADEIPELLAGRVIIGSPEDCAEQLVRLARSTGFTRLIARVQWMGMEQRIVCRTIELLAHDVWPMVERELG
ncbi:LLM class flavin-dependent oxidoreductase [Mycobacterium sp. CVI_P3]|uniref:LLM class flavin-dependent oxidoreductase n=1 Tax=Mycobacterium pinniadriaticum TaxID=2994102 RepID=A0ABT3SNP8_9MYCO|nr:LLM class flavin-dependent oxidoreductase [Mycobacterium pinniadriaticum]MCX2934539.1 LLM class flavin-dependent oxidoreductase [Mycobacterium pinniadriaticum]MCX2940962.1 LLM class flavin-dependent oxidoreductase [Mycobacterium pinniadriaticum]